MSDINNTKELSLKTCNKCKDLKALDQYHKRKQSKDGHSSTCKDCILAPTRQPENRAKSREYEKKYRERNKDKCRERIKKWHQDHPDYNKQKSTEHRRRQGIVPRKEMPKIVRDKEYRRSKYREYFNKNREDINARCRAKRKERMKDPRKKIEVTLRVRVWDALKRHRTEKAFKTIELLGCTIDELKAHLERQFTDDMSWDNYSLKGWHIDHIKPCNTFDLTDPDQQKICFHYTNLRPLWSADNLARPRDGTDVVPEMT